MSARLLPILMALAAASLDCASAAERSSPFHPELIAQNTGKSRPEFKGLHPGMPATDLPASFKRTGDIGTLAGFMGEDYVEAFIWEKTLSQLSIVYYAPAVGPRPAIDRRMTLQEAWRLHSAGTGVPDFGLYLTHLYLVDGLIDTRNLIVYRLQFPTRKFLRDAPPLFDPQTRVERVVYFLDRPDFASNYQPISSKALLKQIADRYADTFAR